MSCNPTVRIHLSHTTPSPSPSRGAGDHVVRVLSPAALAALDPLLADLLRRLARLVHRTLWLRLRGCPLRDPFHLGVDLHWVLAGVQHLHHRLRPPLCHGQVPSCLDLRPVHGVPAPVPLGWGPPFLRTLWRHRSGSRRPSPPLWFGCRAWSLLRGCP